MEESSSLRGRPFKTHPSISMKSSLLQAYWPVLLAVFIGAALGATLGYCGQCTSGTCPLTSTWWRGAIYGGVLGLLFAFSSTARNAAAEQPGSRPALAPVSPQATESAPKDSTRPQ
jgi:hypothetical protein